MGKRKGDQATPPPQAQDQASQAQAVAASEPEAIATPSDASTVPAARAAKAAAPEPAPASPSTAAAPADAATPLPSGPSFVTIDAPKATAPQPESTETEPPAAPPQPIVLYQMPPRGEASDAADAAAETTASAAKPTSSWRRVMPLAASIAIAVAVGAMAGSAATAGLGHLWASPAPVQSADVQSADMRPLRDTITRISAELTALKSSIDHSGRTSHVQLTKLGDRLDRVERAQAEPAAKLTKLAEAVDRIEHRAPAPAPVPAPTSTSLDVTGSITAPATQPAVTPAAAPARQSNPPVLDGWFVRGVYHGAALIQTRYGGVIEVERGDNLPGLGRVEKIHREDGRWVVVTSRGMIVARR